MDRDDDIAALTGLTARIGASGFCTGFFDCADRLFGIDQCCVFVSGGTHPRPLVAEARDAAMLRHVREAAYTYMRRDHRADPLWNRCRDIAFCEPELRRQQLRHGIVQEIVLNGVANGSCLQIVLSRGPERPGFDDAALAQAARWGQMLLAIVQKHSEIAPVLPVAQPAQVRIPHDELLARVRRAIGEENDSLSPREVEICASIVLGYTMVGISLNLGISVNTVATHRKHAYAKLGVSSQNELFARYLTQVENQMPRVQFN